ncbi:MAG TPA: hypothetical protein VMW35_14170 [Myxococcota bacterium]|jgi:hypothetical protein|nr:hypothetical protein [Myxococcota bacterium]
MSRLGRIGRRHRASPLLAALCLFLPLVAQAGDTTPQRDWDLELMPYAWASSIALKAKINDFSATAREPFFNDVLNDLNWAVMGTTELRYRRALLLVDFLGSQIEQGEHESARTRPFRLTALGPGGALTVGPVDGWLRTTMWTVDVKAGLRSVSLPYSNLFSGIAADDRRRIDLDVFLGARYWNVTDKLHVRVDPATFRVGGTSVSLGGATLSGQRLGDLGLPGALLRGGSRTPQEQVDWVDPLIGFRVRADLLETLSAFVLTDCGGWSIGDASRFTLQGLGGLRWGFSEHWSVLAAYRALRVEGNGSVRKMTLYGPELGLAFRF